MKNEDILASKRRGRGVGGMILIIVGACLLLQRLDLDLPHWVFSWQMILITIGILLGFKQNFRGGGWIAMIAVGGIFMAGEILQWPYDTARFIWPVALIVVGLMVMLKRNYTIEKRYCKTEKRNYKTADFSNIKNSYGSSVQDLDGDDYVYASAIFGGANKVIISRDFKGGAVSSIFGGTDLNFMKADINGTVELEITAIMGGCEIIVPSNWTVKVDITSIMGGVEDNRSMDLLSAADKNKVLVLKGSCIMGGVDIKSY
jgi:predicted membrane protein